MVQCFLLCTVLFSLWDHLKWGFTWSVIFCSLGWGHVSPDQFCACFCQAFQEYQLMKANLYVNFLAWGSYIMQVLWVQTLTQVVTASQRQLPFSTQGPVQDRQAIREGLPSPYLHSTSCALICWSQLPCSSPSRFSSLSCKVSWAFQMSVMSCESVHAFFSRRDLGLFHNIAENWSQKIQSPLLKYFPHLSSVGLLPTPESMPPPPHTQTPWLWQSHNNWKDLTRTSWLTPHCTE